jgi:hypothetical protein
MLGLFKYGNWNENGVNILSRINWRASMVPTAPVIPATIVYIKVVTVKHVVVDFLVKVAGVPLCGLRGSLCLFGV